MKTKGLSPESQNEKDHLQGPHRLQDSNPNSASKGLIKSTHN